MIAFLLPAIISAAVALLGLLANWMFDLCEWNIAIVGTIALAACVIIALVSSVWMRLVIAASLAFVMYVHGALDRQAQLAVKHKAEIAKIHIEYGKIATAEEARQRAVNEKAQLDALAEKERYDAEIASLAFEIIKLREESARDVNAKRPAFSIDAIRRLNAIRLRKQQPQS